jgi:hypothetical protein
LHTAAEPPDVVRTLEATMRLCAVRSGELQPDLLRACREVAKPGKDPLGSVVFWSYIPLERKAMEDTRHLVRDIAKATSFEGDGHLMVERNAGPTWAEDLLTAANTVAPHSVKAIPTYDDILEPLRLRLIPPPPMPTPTPAASATPAGVEAEPLMQCASFKVWKVPCKTSPGVVQPFPPTNAANNMNNIQRSWVLIRAHEANAISMEALYAILVRQFDAVLVAEVGGWAGGLVLKNPKVRISKLPDGYLACTAGPDQRHKDANILAAYEVLTMCPHVTNMRLDATDNAVCPTWPAMQEWLLAQRTSKFIDITAEARRGIHLGNGTPHQKALIKVMAAECKEFFEGLQLANGMLRLVGSSSRVFARDFADGIMDLQGMAYNPHTGATEVITLKRVLDESADYLTRSLWFIGPPGYGKTTLIGAIAQEVAHRQGFDSFCEATALDPFGQLTKMGICEKIGAFAISDFDLVSGGGGLDSALSLSDMTSLLDCCANASFKARYHCATLPKHRSRLFAINPTVSQPVPPSTTSELNWGGWFADQGYPIIESFVNGKSLSAYGDRHKALLRRMIVFKVATPLFTLAGATADPDVEQLRLLGGAKSYQL